MNRPVTVDLSAINRELIKKCIETHSLEENLNMDEILSYKCFPKSASKKLAILILCYKKEATNDQLVKISSQPAATIRDLREDGFIFKTAGNNDKNYQYKNSDKTFCRQIIGYQVPKPQKTKVKINDNVAAILDKSISAAISAIELYNKPDFKYREETFSILIINAWELLMKAKLIHDNNGSYNAIYIPENGGYKTNRTGNPMTVDIYRAMKRLQDTNMIENQLINNITLLIEVRDNAIHFINSDSSLSKKVQEYGTANLKNYVTAIDEWFNMDLSKYNFYLMPISFFHLPELESFSTNSQEKHMKNLCNYFSNVEKHSVDEAESKYDIALVLKTTFVKASTGIPFRYSNDKDAIKIEYKEEDLLKQHPLTYNELIAILKSKFTDFKVNSSFWILMKSLKEEERYCRIRYSNLKNKKGEIKYYSTEIIKEFEKHYTKKK